MNLRRSFRKRLAWLAWPTGHGVVRREGALFLLNMRNWVDKITVTDGVMERQQIAYFIDQVMQRQCDTFLDVGANMGTYSVLVALRTSCQTIVAFEPDPRSFDHLRANALLNQLSHKIDARPLAASSVNGTLAFVFGQSTHDALSRVGESPDACRVTCVRLDDELSELRGRNVAIKMDIEEHECDAMLGMTELLTHNRCFMQVECFDKNLPALRRVLEPLGYTLTHAIGVDRYFAKQVT